MKNKSVIHEANEVKKAIEMVTLGARMQMLEAETSLSRERLLKIYKEVRGVSPPKGMLPFSADWFMAWQPNVHSSLFMGFLEFFKTHTRLEGIEAVLKAYNLYLDQIESIGIKPVLSLTRAWTLIRFFDSNILDTAHCTRCNGRFVVHAYDPVQNYVCGLCNMPSRAGCGHKNLQQKTARKPVAKRKKILEKV